MSVRGKTWHVKTRSRLKHTLTIIQPHGVILNKRQSAFYFLIDLHETMLK